MTRSKRAVVERQVHGVAVHRAGASLFRHLASLGHCSERGAYLFELGIAHVAGDDPSTAASRFERVPAEAAPEIEQAISARHAEFRVVDGEHQVARPCAARIVRSSRYCSTVALAV